MQIRATLRKIAPGKRRKWGNQASSGAPVKRMQEARRAAAPAMRMLSNEPAMMVARVVNSARAVAAPAVEETRSPKMTESRVTTSKPGMMARVNPAAASKPARFAHSRRELSRKCRDNPARRSLRPLYRAGVISHLLEIRDCATIWSALRYS